MDEILAKLERERLAGWANGPMPDERDSEFTDVIRQYVAADPNRRLALTQKLSIAQMSMLRAFAYRMSSLALRENSVERLRHGLIAFAIEGFQFDPREDWIVLSLFRHSAEKLSVDFAQLLNDAAAYAPTQEIAEMLRRFANNHASIDQMGFRESSDSSGFRYESKSQESANSA